MPKQTEPIVDAREFTEQELVGMLAGLCTLKEEAADQKKAYEVGRKPIDDYLDKHPGEQLRDGEARITAWLQHSKPERVLDIISLVATDSRLLILDMARLGLLKMDWAAWDAAEGKFEGYTDVLGFIGQGKSKKAALRIERDRR